MRTHPFNRQALSIPKADSSRKNGKVVSPTPPSLPLFYYVTNLLFLGEGIPPPRPAPSPFQELMHQEGWKDLKEILISTLAGKSKRASNLPATQKQAVMSGMGGGSSNLAREF